MAHFSCQTPMVKYNKKSDSIFDAWPLTALEPLYSVPHQPLIKPKLSHLRCRCCVLSHFSRVQLCGPVDCSPPGSFVPGTLQARMLEWAAIPFSRGSSQPRGWTHISCKSSALQADSLLCEGPGSPTVVFTTEKIPYVSRLAQLNSNSRVSCTLQIDHRNVYLISVTIHS